MLLYLLRHAHAEPHLEAGQHDAERPLSFKGEGQALIAGRRLAGMAHPPEVIHASPYERARQTAAIVAKQLRLSGGPIVNEYLSAGADGRQMVREMHSWDGAPVLLVGHEPQLKELLLRLLADGRNYNLHIGLASLTLVSLPIPIVPGTGTLQWQLAIEQMKE